MTTPPRRLILLRHGRTGHNHLGIWQGHLDVALDEVGRAQARAAARVLSRYEPAYIVSSDLARAHETACEVGRMSGVPVETDERLREIHVGQWQGRRRVDVAEEQSDLTAALHAGDDPRRGGDGETVAEVADRVRPVLVDAVERLRPQQTALLVTHGVTSLAAAADFVGLDQRSAWIGIDRLGNCCWGVLEEHPVGTARTHPTTGGSPWRLSGWNLRSPDLGMGVPCR